MNKAQSSSSFITQTYTEAYENMQQYDGFFLSSFLEKVQQRGDDKLFKMSQDYTPHSSLDNEVILKKIIGKDGHWLKLTSHNYNLDYLWFDTKQQQFLFWADNINNCEGANKEIQKRIVKVTKELAELEQFKNSKVQEVKVTIEDDEFLVVDK